MMEETIRRKLISRFAPSRLEVINESHLHAGHAGDNKSGESHFRVIMVSSEFEGLSRIAAQRLVYECLEQELKTIIHALSVNILAC